MRVRTDAQTVALVRKRLKAIDPKLEKQLVQTLKDVGQIVASDARRRLFMDLGATRTVRPPRRTGRAAASIKVGVAGGKVHVKGGGTKATAYYGWLDYGGTLKATGVLRPSRVNTQHRPVRKTGRYIYPAIDAKRELATRRVREVVADVVRELEFDQ